MVGATLGTLPCVEAGNPTGIGRQGQRRGRHPRTPSPCGTPASALGLRPSCSTRLFVRSAAEMNNSSWVQLAALAWERHLQPAPRLTEWTARSSSCSSCLLFVLAVWKALVSSLNRPLALLALAAALLDVSQPRALGWLLPDPQGADQSPSQAMSPNLVPWNKLVV